MNVFHTKYIINVCCAGTKRRTGVGTWLARPELRSCGGPDQTRPELLVVVVGNRC